MAGYFSLIWKTWKLDSAVHIYIKKYYYYSFVFAHYLDLPNNGIVTESSFMWHSAPKKIVITCNCLQEITKFKYKKDRRIMRFASSPLVRDDF